MKIIRCLLHTDNSVKILGKTLSEKILQQNKTHLWEERQKGVVDTVVIHYISAVERMPDDPFNWEAVLDVFCNYSVSSHYLIDRDGVVRQLVPEDKKAWHCGGSIMPEPDLRQGVNEFSMGIELMALKDSDFTEAQYLSLASLCSEIEKRWNINTYVGHEDIAGECAVTMGLRQDIKPDPGPLFDWQRFYTLKSNISVS